MVEEIRSGEIQLHSPALVFRAAAAFGAILAAFDTGVGSGSTSMGWIIQHYSSGAAFGVAAALSALAVPYFLVVDRVFGRPPALRLGGVAIPASKRINPEEERERGTL